jgi:hypothetical protein
MKVNKAMCATCPWREDSAYAYLRRELEYSAKHEASRICHCTGSNAINENTGKPEAFCRGARDVQLRWLASAGFLSAPTDESWDAKCLEIGIEPNNARNRR